MFYFGELLPAPPQGTLLGRKIWVNLQDPSSDPTQRGFLHVLVVLTAD